jgi:hypothetical protein
MRLVGYLPRGGAHVLGPAGLTLSPPALARPIIGPPRRPPASLHPAPPEANRGGLRAQRAHGLAGIARDVAPAPARWPHRPRRARRKRHWRHDWAPTCEPLPWPPRLTAQPMMGFLLGRETMWYGSPSEARPTLWMADTVDAVQRRWTDKTRNASILCLFGPRTPRPTSPRVPNTPDVAHWPQQLQPWGRHSTRAVPGVPCTCAAPPLRRAHLAPISARSLTECACPWAFRHLLPS